MAQIAPTFLQILSRTSLNVAAAFAATTIFCDNIACLADVEGSSMSPALSPNNSEMLVVQKFQAQNIIRPGDVVVLRSPVDPNSLLVKRVIGLSGQTIPIPIDAEMAYTLRQSSYPYTTATMTKPFKVPRGHMWIEGDNHVESVDSRHFGAVPQALLEGIALYKINRDTFAIDSLAHPPHWTASTRPIVPVEFKNIPQTTNIIDNTETAHHQSILQAYRNNKQSNHINLTSPNGQDDTDTIFDLLLTQNSIDNSIPQILKDSTLPTAARIKNDYFGNMRSRLNPYLDSIPNDKQSITIHNNFLDQMRDGTNTDSSGPNYGQLTITNTITNEKYTTQTTENSQSQTKQ